MLTWHSRSFSTAVPSKPCLTACGTFTSAGHCLCCSCPALPSALYVGNQDMGVILADLDIEPFPPSAIVKLVLHQEGECEKQLSLPVGTATDREIWTVYKVLATQSQHGNAGCLKCLFHYRHILSFDIPVQYFLDELDSVVDFWDSLSKWTHPFLVWPLTLESGMRLQNGRPRR